VWSLPGILTGEMFLNAMKGKTYYKIKAMIVPEGISPPI
jgi:hypothetical protein